MTRKTRTPGESGAAPDDSNQQPAAPSAPAAASGLPNAIDIDPKTITGPVLTNQGWVCPDDTDRRPRDALKV